jgi:CubicO group peptidase (beta-lactamase class C family)
VIYRKAYGSRALEPRREPMTLDTIFDLASLTKVIVTDYGGDATRRAGQGPPERPGGEVSPGVCAEWKRRHHGAAVAHALFGLEPDLDLKTAWEGKETAYRMAFAETLQDPPGSKVSYSDINFIVLGALVERVSGETLDEYATRHIFVPLKMMHTRFVPPRCGLAGRKDRAHAV